jgi:hypothetical protein
VLSFAGSLSSENVVAVGRVRFMGNGSAMAFAEALTPVAADLLESGVVHVVSRRS